MSYGGWFDPEAVAVGLLDPETGRLGILDEELLSTAGTVAAASKAPAPVVVKHAVIRSTVW